MFRPLGLFCAITAIAVAVASPAGAQQQALGPYCGEVTWQGQAPTDTWVYLRRNGTWTAAVEGALSEVDTGQYMLDGTTLTMSGGESVQYQVSGSATGGRVTGNVTASDGRRGVISMTQMHGTGSGLRSSPVPPNFAPDAAERALTGDMESLAEALTWGWTPQGIDYWRAIHQSGQIPDHAADALRDWIRRAHGGEHPICDAQ